MWFLQELLRGVHMFLADKFACNQTGHRNRRPPCRKLGYAEPDIRAETLPVDSKLRERGATRAYANKKHHERQCVANRGTEKRIHLDQPLGQKADENHHQQEDDLIAADPQGRSIGEFGVWPFPQQARAKIGECETGGCRDHELWVRCHAERRFANKLCVRHRSIRGRARSMAYNILASMGWRLDENGIEERLLTGRSPSVPAIGRITSYNGGAGLDNILAKIVQRKRAEIEAIQATATAEGWSRLAESAPTPSDFLGAVSCVGGIRVIAELKKASPSAGVIREDFDPVSIAASYVRGGASCLSVLTDVDFFQGSIDYLREVAGAVDVPLLRKDFILDRTQIDEAKLAGASAILLIAECLDTATLNDLVQRTQFLGMAALVELYEPENLERVLDSGARLIGINNRNLRTFVTDLGHTLNLLDQIPRDRTVVSESGIRTRADVVALEQAGVDAILVGEALMRAEDPGAALATLLGADLST